MDTVSVKTRSRIMASIKSKDTKPEIALCKILSSKGYRYKKNYRMGRKTIDIAFVNKKVAVFVDGCFWHGCNIHANKPKSNTKYWEAKLKANILRDKISNKELRKLGWVVVRVWEHEIGGSPQVAVRKVSIQLKSS
ncbi:MAG: very short patch repair endonuclease [Candidatus Micrarchaeota archaeon]|nr:very short patch repair endonuclease [Candidatus Micrarchaeota archaeon]